MYKYGIHYDSLKRDNGGSLMKVAKIYIHEKFKLPSLDHNIALLKLAKKLKLGSINVNSALLPKNGSDLPAGTNVMVTGWGPLQEGGKMSKNLQKVTVPVVDRAECREKYRKKNLPITGNMFCTGPVEGGKGACLSDSGGSVVVNGTVFGFFSWSFGCGRPGYPAVNTRVGNYIDWIKSKLFL